MKRFFLKTGVYAGYVFLLWTSTHLFNTCTGSDKFDYKKKVVILGDSHAELGINPKVISKNCINYSMSAEPLMFTYYKLKKIQNVIGLDTLILGIGPHSFSSFNDRKFTDLRWSNTMFSRGYRLLIHQELDMPVDESLLYKTAFKRQALLPNPYNDQTEYLGAYMPMNPEKLPRLSKLEIDVTIKLHYHHNLEVLEVSNLQLAYFNRINNFCFEEGIKLVLMAPPVHVDYLTAIPEPFIVTYDSIINSYKDSILVLDMLRLSIPDSFFADGDHVNELGANFVGASIKQTLGKNPPTFLPAGFN